MKRTVVIDVIAILFAAAALFVGAAPTISECGQKELEVCAHARLSETVSFWVWNSPPSFAKFWRPRIENVVFYADGQKQNVKPKIDLVNSKMGWGENAEFPTSKGAKVIKVEAVVRTGGHNFKVVQEWRPIDGKWKADKEAVVLRE
jgi:hypothetical protein